MSYRKIIKQVKQKGYSVSVALLLYIVYNIMTKVRFEKTFANLAKLELFQNALQQQMFTSLERPAIWSDLETNDEAMFKMDGSYGRQPVWYVRSNETNINKLKFDKRDSFAPVFIVWDGVCYYGKT